MSTAKLPAKSPRIRSPLPLAPSLFLITACGPQGGPAPAIEGPYVERELMVGTAPGSGEAARLAVLDRYGLVEVEHLPGTGLSRMVLGEDLTVAEALSWISGDPDIDFVEPNYEVQATAVSAPDDPWFDSQWHMGRIGLPEAWEHGRGEGVVVAVLDSGVDTDGRDGFDHVLPGADFVYGGDATWDGAGHGTHVAGTVAQATDNGVGTVGVAPGVTLLPVKVLGSSGSGSISGIAAGLEYAADQGASVANMSLGSWSSSQSLRRAEAYAHDRGVVMVASSGNEDSESSSYPAADPLVISVGATASNDRVSSFSNGSCDLVAPGSYIIQEVAWGGYEGWYGTSMASPHVAGAAALVMAQGVSDPDDVRRILTETARDLYDPGEDLWSGHGLLDAEAAVLQAIAETGGGEPDTGEEPEEGGDEGSTEPEPDTTGPVISDVYGEVGAGWFRITWTTDEAATSDIVFDPWGEYPQAEYVTEHSRKFTAQSGQRFYFDVKSVDEAGNVSVDEGWHIDVP